ncbi:hypothetical protein G6L15_09515 [Agrobacterium rhizogenes]|uniref:hypothetical protein n=1 Tax=Rhizobium rhizogenes TaxID=359 RepID=UPI001571E2E4|nr:hypothetical protein [Rhizobium rhizogenes]NTG86376.1 hypothetical protein [Rhizobium rhizogenes]
MTNETGKFSDMLENPPPAPEWNSVKRPDHGKRRDDSSAKEDKEDQARLVRLSEWIELKSTHDVYSQNAPRMTDAEFEEFLKSGLTAEERALLLREIDRKRSAKDEKRKRGERHFPEIAGALRSSPSARFLHVVADMIEIGFFTSRVNLDEDFAVLQTAKIRQQILDTLVDAYGKKVPRHTLQERATDLTPFFLGDEDRRERSWEDRRNEVKDYKNTATDKTRTRVVRLLYSIRHNIGLQEK